MICESAQAGTVVAAMNWSGRDSGGEWASPPAEYALLRCNACGDATLQVREDVGGEGMDQPVTVYPAPRQIGWGVPDALRQVWTEATKCFEASAYAATVVMVRRTLEGTCQLQGVTERNLSTALGKMKERGLVDETLMQWSTALRIVGNKGAHFGDHVSRQDAEDALHFAEAFLNHVYVLRVRFEEFQQRVGTPTRPPAPRTDGAGGHAS
ncbi:hypothetical protein CXY01_03910 [Cellulomonas xylanilytica]|uniref:DUF4145 domain-containing protein n=1 Tax=Cellulomonas xylanilytica TaxID=233583 RepID=A0A510V214_9CELL|nr:hypothetical protein CXY01_03910 [Cellulomonas xylanilytica]